MSGITLRIQCTVLGRYGYVLEGYHPDIWRSEVGRPKIHLLRKVSKLDSAFPEVLFPELSDMPMEIPRTCPNCKGCHQCQYEICDMTFREKKELDALHVAVYLDVNNSVC